MYSNMPKAFVTGGGRGIGFAIATKLADEGYSVTITGRDKNRLEESIARLSIKHGQTHKILIADYADLSKEVVIDEDADVLVNNAGINIFSTLVDLPISTIQDIITIDFISVLYLSKKFIANRLKQNKYGQILNVSSVAGLKGHEGAATYSSAKAAVNNLTLSLAKEYGHKGIKVNAICPGTTATAMSKGFEIALQANRINLGEFISVETVADMSWAIINNPNMTGSIIIMDNGANL